MRIKTTAERGRPNPITDPSYKGEQGIDHTTLLDAVTVVQKDQDELLAEKIIADFDINDKSTWHFEGVFWDEVFEAECKVYWMPTARIEKDKWSQNRKNDSDPNVIAEYARYMELQGQKRPFCVWVNSNRQKAMIRWGNTRKRGQDKLYSDGRRCKDLPPGLSRVILYDKPFSELPAWQSKENHSHTKCENNDLKSDIANLNKAIDNGMLNYGAHPDLSYSDSNKDPYHALSDDEKIARLKVYCSKFMILRSGRAFGTKTSGFYKAFVRDNQDDFDIRSWTPGELLAHFLKSNPLGLDESHRIESSIKNCFEKDGVKYGVWFSNDIVNKGAYIQQAIKAKFITKACDETILVTADPAKETCQISNTRNKTKTDMTNWNKVKKCVDHSLHAPLTEEEEKSVNQWSVYNKY
tara:strand:+ start:606 stop:1832 length:1227 start_codon:yes stop_codon:yes gene_type:complete